ncbi:hypothetical protein SH591_05380 [Sphingomonas sp. LY54]|uniref:hypothetical protein n=1 Tax=Sphingomonas sp. LY54 TaxID=3095343 RepID=UPI002D7A06A6|nr:hypothetical protein [Sphingomonas sp. LY54]WRP29610.1 hypothetical protein SH591_05380 [Sphingomonas sp. LY54]
MNAPQSNRTQAGGFLIAASVIVGSVAGMIVGQPSAGFVVGLATGVILAVVLWRRDRRR